MTAEIAIPISPTSGVTYHVLNEHTLCYRQPASEWLNILHASVLRGSPYDRLCWRIPPPIGNDFLRPATVEDFHAFNVSPVGHLPLS